MSASACCISSIDSERSCFASSGRPQSSNIFACRKYWLMAVSSFFSTRLRNSFTFASRGFMAVLHVEGMPVDSEASCSGRGDVKIDLCRLSITY